MRNKKKNEICLYLISDWHIGSKKGNGYAKRLIKDIKKKKYKIKFTGDIVL